MKLASVEGCAVLALFLPKAVEGWAEVPSQARNLLGKVPATESIPIHYGNFVPDEDAAWVLAAPLSHTMMYEPLTHETTAMDRLAFFQPVHPSLPKLWLLTLHSQSLTRVAFQDSKTGILQCLSHKQKEDIGDLLDKRSGYHNDFHFSKRQHCAEIGLDWKSYSNLCEPTDPTNEDDDELLTDDEIVDMEVTLSEMDVLPKCDAYLKVKLLKTIPAGDFSVAMCEVVGFGQWDEGCQKVLIKHNLHLLPPSPPLGTLMP